MFESLSQSLSRVFDQLVHRGTLTDEDVTSAMREVRRSLLEADVALEVVRPFIDRIRTKAVGQKVLKSIKPGQMVIKIVSDGLVDMLGSEAVPLNLEVVPPVTILMVGLQGAGKTTTTAKLAKRLSEREKRKVLMVSLDVKRPAAQEQLAVLGQKAGIDTLPIISGQDPLQITQRAQEMARLKGYDVVLLDSAGRTHVDAPLMAEIAQVKALARPHETLLVADSLTGQDAVHLAKNFHEHVALTGIVLTRMDGDGRGGAALSMRHATGQAIKFIGTGEKIEDIDIFDPQRMAQRILGMGDIVALVEQAAKAIDAEKAEALAKKMSQGRFDLQDYADQLAHMEQMGGIEKIMGLLPGMGALKDKLPTHIGEGMLKRQRAIILSMTPVERRNPDLLKASRKKRIAAGSGTKVEDVNRLLKQHHQMADMMKMMQGNKRGALGRLGQMFGFGGASHVPSGVLEGMAKMPQKGEGPLGAAGLPPLPSNLKLPSGLGGGWGGMGAGALDFLKGKKK